MPLTVPPPIEARPAVLPPMLAVLAHFGPADRSEKAVAALRASGYPGLRILVVDNSDGQISEALDASRLGEGVELELMGHNAGYCAAVNRGLARASELELPLLALVNTDLLPRAGCLEALVDALLSDERRVGAGPLIVSGDGQHVWCAGAKLRFGPNVSVLCAHGRSRERAPKTPALVDYLPGALAVYRTAALRAVGGVEEEFFMYGEDVDLGLRLRLAGGQLLYVPWAEAVHDATASSGGGVSPLRKFLNAVNTPRLLRRIASPRLWLAFVVFDLLGLLPSMLLHLHRPRRLRAQWAKARGVLLGLGGYRPSARDVEEYLGRRP